MITGNEPAMPIKGADDRFFSCSNKQEYEDWALQTNPSIGLTKREHFAAMAMQGLLSSVMYTDKQLQKQSEAVGGTITEAVVIASTYIADALIAELNKPTTK